MATSLCNGNDDNNTEKTETKKINFSYLKHYGNRGKYTIPSCFTKYHFKQSDIFEARISNIYDLSKFWIVSRFKELEVFQIYLYRFYETNKESYRIPHNKIEKDQYCIAYTSLNYYRGIIIDIPVTVGSVDTAKIYFYDFGIIDLININDLYYMESKCFSVPQFAIRASLAGICPKNTHTWTSEHSRRFLEIVKDKTLMVQISNIDTKHQVLDIFLKLQLNDSITIQDKFINDRVAQYFNYDRKINKTSIKEENVAVKYLYLFPSHELIESGQIPCSIEHIEFVKELMPIIGPLKQYYKDNEINGEKS